MLKENLADHFQMVCNETTSMEIALAYYIMVGEGVYPIAPIKKCYREHLEVDWWTFGEKLHIEVPQPIVYDLEVLDEDDYDQVPNVKNLADHLCVPFMHNSLYEALLAAGVDNLQVYDAVIRDIARGIDHRDFKAYNVVGLVAAADMEESTMMGTSDSTLIDADFDRLVIDESKCNGLLLFRLAENFNALVVHERVKQEVERRGIKGIFFYANGEWAG